MALTFQPQHLAWKERVTREVAHTVARFPPISPRKSLAKLKPHSRAHRATESPTRNATLGYIFGGTAPAKYAFQPVASFSTDNLPRDPEKRYIDTLRTLLEEEKRLQSELEAKIRRRSKAKLALRR